MANDTTIELIELSSNELHLIKVIRNCPYGEVTVVMHNKQPVRLKRIYEFTSLEEKDFTGLKQ